MGEKSKETKSKGIFTSYTTIPVKTREYYYDYYAPSKEGVEFSAMAVDLDKFNDKLKDEIKKERTVKFKIDDRK